MQGLSENLRGLVNQLEMETQITFQTEIDDLAAAPLIELLAYQVAREAIRNVIKHAEATVVRVTLSHESPGILLVIEDDGRGFHPQLVDETSHFGIALMRERVELARGVADIDSSPEGGTRLTVRLPLEGPGLVASVETA